MLTRLSLQNIAIIASLTLDFQPGMNAITGETGSGKSLMLSALQRVFDKKNSPKDLLRHGAARGQIELTFDLNRIHNRAAVVQLLTEAGIDLLNDEHELILGREFTATNSRCRINGVPVTTDVMEKLGTLVMEIYGQHDLHTLFSTARQRDLVDNLGGEPLAALRKAVRKTFRLVQQLQQQIEVLSTQQASHARQLDFLTFQIQEIEATQIIDPEEDTLLHQERERLSHSEQLSQIAVQAANILHAESDYDTATVLSLLSKVQKQLNQGATLDPQLATLYEQLIETTETLRTMGHTLDQYQANVDTRPERMNEIVDRLDVLDRVKRKYGGTLPTVLETLSNLEDQLGELEGSVETWDSLTAQLAEAQAEYTDLCASLTQLRHRIADSLTHAIQQELAGLMLSHAQFGIQFETTPPSDMGQDQVTFLFSANPGEPLKPLAHVASGGELARLMLAIKIQTAHADSLTTLILDEVDTGMSGITVRAIADKLIALQTQCQIILITHQPIVAARAPWHIHIQKQLGPDGMSVNATPLTDRTQRTAVLGQLASGLVEDNASAHQFIEQLLIPDVAS